MNDEQIQEKIVTFAIVPLAALIMAGLVVFLFVGSYKMAVEPTCTHQ